MNIYVVFCHPNPDSLNRAILKQLTAGLEEAGHTAVVSDLYADGFNPVLSAADLKGAAEGAPVADDVKAYQDKISAAEGMAFVFPIWWFAPPALLKGWFDRVLTKGFAYDFTDTGMKPLLKVQKALVLSTAGGMEQMYKNIGFTDAINRVLVNGTLQFTGIFQVKSRTFHYVVDCDDECRKGFLEEAKQLGKSYF